jgi:hypothetical protein
MLKIKYWLGWLLPWVAAQRRAERHAQDLERKRLTRKRRPRWAMARAYGRRRYLHNKRYGAKS